MPNINEIDHWVEEIHRRYRNYLQTLFFFKDSKLRKSFQDALNEEEENLFKGPFPESTRTFQRGVNARELARECFPQKNEGLLPALINERLYKHQEQAIRKVHLKQRNIVVTTGTGSGKTESFLYPILFELYRQHLEGKLKKPGIRAMILYPMNALANDQRNRLGEICQGLKEQGAGFVPTFGQYTGQTPDSERDDWRHAQKWKEERLPGELIFRNEMRENPPHILLTNYSMLEYLLIRPKDSPLFDNGFGKYWQFIVLDEAHQYKGTKGMEMGMLIRRLKQRLRDGGREDRPFQCIATSATMSSSEGGKEKKTVAEFAEEIFNEDFSSEDVIFGEYEKQADGETQPSRYHVFVRALEGVFLVHKKGKDQVVLNRKTEEETDSYTNSPAPLEIALCRECGQHYYVGRGKDGYLEEAIRDPSQIDFGVEYYLPLGSDISKSTHRLCRRCGAISPSELSCDCDKQAQIPVKKCQPHDKYLDRLKECEVCGYRRGGVGDPVQEVVHGSDGPNAVIATTLHELLPEPKRKVLAFADSRQGAAFFAWYIEDTYEDIRDRNLILRAMDVMPISVEGLSITDLSKRLLTQQERVNLFGGSRTPEGKRQKVFELIFREALTDKRRLSLEGVGLIQWFVEIPNDIANDTELFKMMESPPWNLKKEEAYDLLRYLIDEFRRRRAVDLSEGTLSWGNEISPWPQRSLTKDLPGNRKYVAQWGGAQSTIVRHFLRRLYDGSEVEREKSYTGLLKKVWRTLSHNRSGPQEDQVLCRAPKTGNGFRLNSSLLRVRRIADDEYLWQCDTCKSLSNYNIKGICPRNRCLGNLENIKSKTLDENHYRTLYKAELPPVLSSEEHTAQIESNEAQRRQKKFKDGEIHLLSSSTTFELGVDLGELEVVFLRNVPPEPFNYTQRAGRAGRRDTPGLVLTYCRRNAHDLYHYENPEERMIRGLIRAPRLKLTNTKIILRHMVATALSAFFRANEERFSNVEKLVGNLENPHIVSDVKRFCENNDDLKDSLVNIVPKGVHGEIGLLSADWIEKITDGNDHFQNAETGVSYDYKGMQEAKEILKRDEPKEWTDNVKQLENYMHTIASDKVLNFLSRKAIIPKYGFPVDVVELEVHQKDNVTLQRDLSQAIAEYAPGSTVIANKREWESSGIKLIPNKLPPVRPYYYDKARNFKEPEDNASGRRYLSPIFGFVTPFFKKHPKGSLRQAQRLYTTRPFFLGFEGGIEPQTKTISNVKVTLAQPGNLVILCEGKHREGFYICLKCGAHFPKIKGGHLTPFGLTCPGTIQPQISLGHKLVTDVVRMQFPGLTDEWVAYSVAYAVLLGAAETLGVPDTDLNVTITGGAIGDLTEIVLYDNVPGGAGLVAYLEEEYTFNDMLHNAVSRVMGGCRCDISCYGCLRSYRNQFAHPHLDRKQALELLTNL